MTTRQRPERAPNHPATLPVRLSFRRPKGEQLQEILLDLVETLNPGARLPSERDLAARYGVARMTVRQELDRLALAGRVVRRRGHGTLAAEPKLVQSSPLSSFSHEMRSRGLIPGAQLLSMGLLPAASAMADRFGLGAGVPIVHVVRVRTANGVPLAVERTNLPAGRFPDLETTDLSGGASLYQLLERRYGVRPATALQRVSAILPDRLDAGLLGIDPAMPCFSIERTTRDDDAAVFEFARSVYRGDRYDVVMRIERQVGR